MPATKPRTSRTSSRSRAKGGTHAIQKGRLAGVRRGMRRHGLDALLITNPVDIRYLTGFSGEASYALVTRTQFWVISDFRFQEELAALGGLARVFIRTGEIVGALGEVAGGMGLGAIGFQSEHLAYSTATRIAKLLGVKNMVPTSGVLSDLRQVKDESELKSIRAAVKIQEDALVATLGQIDAGMTELEVTAILEYEMKARGSTDPAFGSIVAAGANGSLPHAIPGKAKLKRNSTLLIDWGATVNGYRSDMTRTFALGKWPTVMREVYEVVLEAHYAGIEAIRPGAIAGKVDAAARKIIDDAGYGKEFGHSLGHGIGLNVHEAPGLRAGADTVLEPGMVVTVEPGIYLPGVGGVRIEDDVLVTARGARSLCSLPKDIRWATLT